VSTYFRTRHVLNYHQRPGNKGRLCYPTQFRPTTCPGSLAEDFVRPEKEGMAHFLPSRNKFCELYECRGTNLIGAVNLSPFTKLVAGTGAVSRYKLSRSQKFVKVQDYNCVHMRESGCNGHYEFVLGAGAKAKSVTNNLPLLSVLGCRVYLFIL
jgi:hypothetical protein